MDLNPTLFLMPVPEIPSSVYLQREDTPLNNFKELSYEAWRHSEQVNKEQAAAKKAQSQRDSAGAAIADEGVETVHYWLYSPGDHAACWDEFYNDGIMGIGWGEIGDLSSFNSKDEMKQRGWYRFSVPPPMLLAPGSP